LSECWTVFDGMQVVRKSRQLDVKMIEPALLNEILTWDACPYLYQSTTCKKTPISSALPVSWTLRSSKPPKSISAHRRKSWCGTFLSDISRCTISKSHKRSRNDWTSPSFSWSTRSRVPRIKTCSRPSPFPEVYTRRSAASIVHTADELIPGILSDVKDPVCVDSYSRSYVWLYDRESVTTWPSPLHIHLNPTANYRANK
jgi:hypothetical protein